MINDRHTCDLFPPRGQGLSACMRHMQVHALFPVTLGGRLMKNWFQAVGMGEDLATVDIQADVVICEEDRSQL